MSDPTPSSWTTLRLLEWTREFFEARGIEDARLEAELLLAHALGAERIQLYVQHGRVVGEPELSRFRDLVKRRAGHVPTQYLLGRAWFRSLTLKVTPAVLIPRPETEILVDEALAVLRKQASDLRPQTSGAAKEEATTETTKRRVFDLCTGSGCIAIAIAAECAGTRVVATDLSAEALAVARENAATAGMAERVTLLQGDLFAALEGLPAEERRFDLITANPPYIGEAELAELMPEVRDHEPRQALVAGPTGLEIVERILADGPPYLVPGGHLLMEIGFKQSEAVRARVAARPEWEWVAGRKDFGGHERVVKLKIKN